MTDPSAPDIGPEMLRGEAWDWVLRLTSGHATESDMAALERWRAQSPHHDKAFVDARERWRSFGPAVENVARQDAAVRFASEKARAAIGRRAFLGGAIAASAAGVAFLMVRPPLDLWPSVGELTADYRTSPGEQRRIALADQVSVELNTRTSLNIQAGANADARIELLSGEAAVTTKSKPIELTAAGGRVWADAAQFNVRCDATEASITCLTGTVQAEYRGQSVTIREKQQISYTANGFGPMAAIDPSLVTGWRKGDLFFQDEPLSRVIEELNRYRPGRIILINAALGQRRFTAHFKLDRLDAVFTQLQAAFGTRVTTLPGGIVLLG